MNKKLNKKIFSGVLALSFVFGSGLVSTVSENLGLEYSNVAYAADSIWDIPKDDKYDWIRTSTLDKMGYSKVNLGGATSYDLSLKNGKVYYRDSISKETKPLPDKGYTWDSLASYTTLINFLTSNGYEVRQEKIYDDPTSGDTFLWGANDVLIWTKTPSYGVVRDSIWDIPKDDKFDWIRTSTLDKMGYSKVNLGNSSYDLSLKNGKVYYRDAFLKETKPLPDKGYTWDSLNSYTTSINFLTSNGYEVRQEAIYDDPTSGDTFLWDANNVLIWRKIKKENEIYNPVANKISVNSVLELTPEKAKFAIKKGSVPDDSTFRFTDTTTDLTVGDNKRKVEIKYKKDASKDLVDVTVSYLPDDITLEDYDKLNDTDKKLYSVIEFRNADDSLNTTMVRLKSVLNKGTVEAPKLESKDGYTVEWKLTAQ